jgi:hypothetical protein
MRTPHTSCWPGKRVLVKLKDGRKIKDRFMEKKGQYVILKTFGKVPSGDIQAFTIIKAQ